ncbi:uncharacterized protein N7515_008148 [Penicillium bovifimosum]|uniref:Bifunctional cytochrome P450/NADPH--P450 reductase n=1 Tax=Penicillium bovifimosum TaxID=126998 RepID=A0A9W9GMG7_9EURO|nr:uncharacterized protein N7515_008148 [Penicillium bovifimosum]KAJ5124323.1 hypothetical protein N7515_008148 [Penicillium bovifimosum]
MSSTKQEPIPGPKGVPFLGNIYDIEPEVPVNSFELLADNYGPIYRLTTFGRPRVFVNSHELVDEVCDEERFTKMVSAGLHEIRNGVHDGLFTANYPGEENWAIAHRILVPAFGPLMIRGMFDEMYDIAQQLVLKWARIGPAAPIQVTDDFTRLTLDTIALCAMGTRFNSFYHDEMHPFVEAMVGLLAGSGKRSLRPALLNNLPTAENNKYWSDIEYLRNLARELVDARKQNPVDKKDLLNALILGRDPQTGQGHETTSGMLSFLFYYLLKSPSAYKKAQEEVDRVIGKRKITVDDMSKLPYITAVMRETLRLKPTAPMIALHPHPVKNKEDPVTLGGGKYVLNKDETIAVNLSKMQRDPKVYGPDADEFKPERMLDENFEKLPKNAWKPFGNGMRGCIGRPFAWQEALLVVAVLLQNFNFQMDNPSYDLRIKQTLTIKPKDFHMKATLRDGLDPTQLSAALSSSDAPPKETGAGSRDRKPKVAPVDGKLKPMHVFYGSNTGTCEAFARRLADDAAGYGYAAQTHSLDSAMQNIPKDGPVVFISASYEGKPPDNAAHFFEWLTELKGNSLEGINYATFGCGHHDWSSTFYHVPKVIDQLVKDNGANKLCDIGLADAANSDMFTDFDGWGESLFWPAVIAKFGGAGPELSAKPKSSLQVEVSSGMRASTLGLQLEEGFVLDNQLLTPPGAPAKRIVKFKLPSDMTYQCGDYLAVLPVNPSSVVRRAIRRFDLPWDAVLRVQKPSGSTASPSIPIDTPISAFELLSTYIELSQPASKRDLNVLADAAINDAETQAELRYLASSPSRFTEEIVKKRVSPLDLLTRYPTIKLPIGDFLAMLPPMRVRQYSISSSPLLNPSECSITFSVLSAPALANAAEATEDQEQYLGVASNYLSELQVGERAHITVRPSHSGFKPPMDLETPMIMACAGSGLAPFRGFVVDRAEKIRGRRSTPDSDELHEHKSLKPAKAVLYIGCRTQGVDDIHAAELAEWAKLGAVEVRWAYSRPSGGSKGQHVQDLMLEDREELVQLFDQGANIYVCGSTGVGAGVRGACKEIYLERRRALHAELREKGERPPGADIDEERAAEEFFEKLRTKERYATDVFT